MVISSPIIDPWTSCVRIKKYHGAVNVVAESELLVGEADIVDWMLSGEGLFVPSVSFTLLSSISTLTLAFAGGCQLVSGPSMHVDAALYLGFSSSLEGKAPSEALSGSRYTGTSPDFRKEGRGSLGQVQTFAE
jgi:hypothetical protein